MASREARRNCSTWRSSSGMARTAMVPACGLAITARPSPLLSRPRRASTVSTQKSLLEVVVICVPSGAPFTLPGVGFGVPPVLPVPLDVPEPPVVDTGMPPPDTRISLRPLRCEVK